MYSFTFVSEKMGKHLTELEIGRIQGEFKARYKKNIAAMAWAKGKSWETIHRAVNYVEKKVRKPRKTLKRVQDRRRAVVEAAKEVKVYNHKTYPANPTLAEIKESITSKFKASRATICRDLKKSDFVCRVRNKAATRDPEKIKLRLVFAKGWLKPNKVALHKRIVFSDEHTLSVNDHTSRTMYVPKSQQHQLIPRERRRLQNVWRIMIWAAVGHNYKSPLVIFPQTIKEENDKRRKETMTYRLTGDAYVKKCLSKVHHTLKGRIFMQDGASPHGRNSENSQAVQYLRGKKVELLLPWVSDSPDMNMQERVWKELNKRVSKMHPQTLDDLKRCAKVAWENFSQADLNKIVAGFKSQLQKVVRVKGGVPK